MGFFGFLIILVCKLALYFPSFRRRNLWMLDIVGAYIEYLLSNSYLCVKLDRCNLSCSAYT